MEDLLIIYSASILTFVLFGWDKYLAVYNKRRIPEFILLLFAFLGGAFGGLCGMILFKHKIKQKLFTITIPILMLLQVAIAVLLRVFAYI